MNRPPILLRYPGGKSRKVKTLLPFLRESIQREGRFLEPFVGGGAMALTVASEFPDATIHINDADNNIFNFWSLVVHGSESEIGELFQLLERGATLEIFDQERIDSEDYYRSRVKKAYHAIFFSKTTHNGIFFASPIGGRNQEGKKWNIDCQFNPANMEKTFYKIRKLLTPDRTTVTQQNALNLLRDQDPACPMYLDPPYYGAGRKCYPVWMQPYEHQQLSVLLKEKSAWLLSYDDCIEVRTLYNWARIKEFSYRYSMASHGSNKCWRNKTELLVTTK